MQPLFSNSIEIEKDISTATTNRIKWIDCAKGIAILFVVIGHIISSDSLLNRFINSFHMPLFFMLSGLFVLKNTNQSFREHFVSRFKRLMIPYLVFGLFFVIPSTWVYFHFIIPDTQIPFLQRCLAHLTGLHSDWGEEWRCCLWFLPCLFVSDLMIWSIWKYSYRWRYIILSILVISGIAYALTINTSLPMRSHTALIAVIFLFIGTILIDVLEKIPAWAIAILAVCYALLWTCNDYNGIIMADNNYGIIYYSLPASILISIVIMYIARYISNIQYLTLLGTQTLAIYILTHPLIPLTLGLSNHLHIYGGGLAETIVIIPTAVITAYICAKAGQYLQTTCPWVFGMKLSHSNHTPANVR